MASAKAPRVAGDSVIESARRDTPLLSVPHTVQPMLATLVDEPFDRPGWFFEIKWDGYRAIGQLTRGRVSLYSRRHNSFLDSYRPIADSLSKLKHEVVLDGEVVVVDAKGRPQFQLLQGWQKTKAGSLRYYVFDILWLDGHDLRKLPLRRRKEVLTQVLAGAPENIQLSEHIEQHGVAFYSLAEQQGLEGIMAKDGDCPYREGKRTHDWLKIKTQGRQEAVIGGFTEPRGSRKDLGALVLGVYEGDDLVYVGHTGGGFDTVGLTELRKKLEPLVVPKSPFRKRPKTNAPVHWVRPELVCEVKFQQWTDDGHMRMPIFLGLRKDKPARAVRRETAEAPPPEAPERTAPAAEKATSAANGPILTNLEKVYWPDEGYTKGDLIDYYREVAAFILPYLRDRPETLNRHPNGIRGKSFYQKDVTPLRPPGWVQTALVPSERHRTIRYLLCQDERTLLYLANLGCIEINPLNGRAESVNNPDYVMIDLDPQDVPYPQVVEAAQHVHRLLDRIGATSVCKTSGKRGLHIYIPLAAQYDTDQATQFAQLVANIVQRELPDTTSVVRSPALRRHRVYLDYLQNRRGQTLAAVYSVRPYPGATVSTPLQWREVNKRLDPSRFTMWTVPKRLEKVGDLWAPVLGKGIDLPSCLRRLVEE